MSIPDFLPNVNVSCSNDENVYFHVAQPFVALSSNSVNVDGSEDTSPNTEPLQPTTLNVPMLHSCSLCWRHADFHYEHPRLETLHLCKMCQRLLTPLGFLALMRRDMPGDETKHTEMWIARHTQEASA